MEWAIDGPAVMVLEKSLISICYLFNHHNSDRQETLFPQLMTLERASTPWITQTEVDLAFSMAEKHKLCRMCFRLENLETTDYDCLEA